MIGLYHVNFHTARNRQVFLDDAIAESIKAILREVMRAHRVVCLALAVMPTHVHLILVDFPDLDRGKAVQLVKGASAHRFLEQHPAFREDLGGHLWQEGYSWRQIVTHRQFVETVAYIRQNRGKAGLAE